MADDKILDRVQKLLSIADHPNTPAPEAELALRQANSLITKHAIDEALLRQSQSLRERRAPEKRNIPLAEGMAYNSVYSYAIAALRTILDKTARTYRCSAALVGQSADVYGAAEDVAWVEMLYTSVYFQLMSQINPRWDSSKGYDENVYNFKVAGYKWSEIDALARKNDSEDARVWKQKRGTLQDVRDYDTDPDGEPIWEPRYAYSREFRNVQTIENDNLDRPYGVWEEPTDKIRGSMISAYRRHAKKIGDTNPVATQSHDVYKMSFIEGFKNRMWIRLDDAEREAKEQTDTIPGAALALVSMTEEARQMMYEEHPELDPEQQRLARERAKQEYADRLAAMSPQERAKHLEEQERLARKANKPRKVKYYSLDDSASMRGRKTADSVNIARNSGATGAASERGAIGS